MERLIEKRTADIIKGEIEGTTKVANAWFLPQNADYHKDGCIKLGNYLEWRKKKLQQ